MNKERKKISKRAQIILGSSVFIIGVVALVMSLIMVIAKETLFSLGFLIQTLYLTRIFYRIINYNRDDYKNEI